MRIYSWKSCQQELWDFPLAKIIFVIYSFHPKQQKVPAIALKDDN
jgi:hypothetical protein